VSAPSLKARRLRLGSVLLLGQAIGCSSVLGIEEAHYDPLFGAGTNPDAGADGSDGAAADSNNPVNPSDGSAGDGAGQTTSDGGDGGESVCQTYCTDIMRYCTGNMMQYIDIPQCLKVCSLFPPGETMDGSQGGNTAACRQKYAGKMKYASGSELDGYCQKAGPASDGTCGSICEAYCTLMMPTCTADRTPSAYFASTEECMSACGGLPDVPPYTVADGTLPDRYDAQCRMFHTCSAVMDPDEHCDHAIGATMCKAMPDGGTE
jgi:hypothetical protein